jgi:F0F1-type ATP synthase membrane subunit c/vacuolar-type H+-ATPase subunit K
MNLAQLAIAVVTGAIPLTASFYTYDQLAGSSSFKRSVYSALAGLGAGVVASLAMTQLIGVTAENPVMTLNSSRSTAISGLADAWNVNMMPPRGGIPMNVYSKMPDVAEVGKSFGVV